MGQMAAELAHELNQPLYAIANFAEASLGRETRRLHYLSVPPSAALPVVRMLGEAGLVENARGPWRPRGRPA